MSDEATIEGLMKLIRELREHEFAHRLDEAEDCTLAISGQLTAFADRIRQDAMEGAAKICDTEALRMKAQIADDVWCGHADTGAMVCASAIRSRKP